MDAKVIIDALPEILTQLLGFLLLLAILKKYAFKAVFDSVKKRQEHITGQINEVENQRAEMEKLKLDYEQRMRKIEHEAREQIQESIREGNRIAGEIRKKAQGEAAKEIDRAKKDIDREIRKAEEIIHQQIAKLSTQIAEKIIKKNVSGPENEKFVSELLKKTESLS